MSETDDLTSRLLALRNTSDAMRRHVVEPIELPEPGFVLDLQSRKGDIAREFKHLHTMCSLNAENFRITNQRKLLALLDGYISSTEQPNPFGHYLFARTILELNAFLFDVSSRLLKVVAKPDNQWKPKGEEFFGLIIRARFATTHPQRRVALEEIGVSAKNLDPLSIMHSLNELATDSEYGDLVKDYDDLCDAVHHNASSQIAANAGFRVGSAARMASGGFLMDRQGPVTVYEYPLVTKARHALGDTVDVVARNTDACVKWVNRMPWTPFSTAQLIQMTGSALGFRTLNLTNQGSPDFRNVGRNDACPCGSGKKFKLCCGGRHA